MIKRHQCHILQRSKFKSASQLLTGSGAPYARFGTAIANLNDISDDGFRGKEMFLFVSVSVFVVCVEPFFFVLALLINLRKFTKDKAFTYFCYTSNQLCNLCIENTASFRSQSLGWNISLFLQT